MINSQVTTLVFQQLCKEYGAVKALQPLSHQFTGGRIHAVIGKNGSGKSTLIKMMAGATTPTSGEMVLNGQSLTFKTPQDALKSGVVTVHQELSLIPELTVAENIFLGRMPQKAGFIQWGQLHNMAAKLLAEVGATNINPSALVSSLSVGKQQVVEIAKAMSLSPLVLQLDEPTSALAQDEVEHLFALLKRLRAKGVLIIYVSHRLAELPIIADDITVLRDGVFVGQLPIAQATPKAIVDMMFGEIEEFSIREKRPQQAEVVLEVNNLKVDGLLNDISFKLHRGEVLGIAGMLGSGRTEILRGIFGADVISSGEITVGGQRVHKPTPMLMNQLGVGYTSEDRKVKGLVQLLSCHANVCMAGMRLISRHGWTSESHERPFVKKQIDDLLIKVGNPLLPVSSLSGGNQQKILVGNWLNTNPKVILFDEPSRGVDVHAKQQIFQMMWNLTQQGLAAIVVSTELEELPAVCDRILVLKNGRFTNEFSADIGAKALYEACMIESTETSISP